MKKRKKRKEPLPEQTVDFFEPYLRETLPGGNFRKMPTTIGDK